MSSIVGASISYRLAFGPSAGKKALTLQTLPTTVEHGIHSEQVSKRAGFSLHAGVAWGRRGVKQGRERNWNGSVDILPVQRLLTSQNSVEFKRWRKKMQQFIRNKQASQLLIGRR